MTSPRKIRGGPASTQADAKRIAAAVLMYGGLALFAQARGADTPAAPAVAPAAIEPLPPLAANPAETMAAMARELDRNAATVVLMIETTPITQAEMADVVRSMPVSFASLGFAEVSRRALDILVSQKAMALNARKDGIDKDEAVGRQQKAAADRVLADAWLTRQADAAVTDQALRARYDREIAGRPGPEEVRVRLILSPTEEEARAIIAKARDGADFASLAKTYSKAPNAARGGDLGFASFDALAPEIASVVFSLSPGEVSAFPVRSPAGFFVLRVEGRRQKGTPTFDEARPGLEREIRAEAISTAIQSVMDHIKVVPFRK